MNHEFPFDKKREHQASFDVATLAIKRAEQAGRALDDVFIEEAAAEVHAAWEERNAWRAEKRDLVVYHELPESEKVKDRTFVREALTQRQLIQL